MMKLEELAEIKKRVEAASDGPWELDDLNREVWNKGGYNFIGSIRIQNDDAEFIAHAREDVPKLLAEIERLKLVAHEILEDYDRAERRVIDEVSTNRRFALDVQERVIKSYQNDINGVDDDDEN